MSMKTMNKIGLAIGVATMSSSVLAATHIADSRGNGMGNTGVASADYLVAPFYNPALTAQYRESDNFALLIPGVGMTVRDSEDTLQEIDDLQDTIDQFKASPDQSNINQLNSHLDDLTGNKPLTVTATAGIAVAIPNAFVAVNFFGRGYVEIIAETDIASLSESGGDTQTRYENSNVNLAAFGYTEYGISFAKKLVISGQEFSLGISPKYQELRTYSDIVNVEDFDLDDYDESEVNDTAFNLDLGAVWYKEQWRVAFAIRDLFKQEIETANLNYKYELTPQATLGFAYSSRFFTAALDADLTAQTRYANVDDDTQFVRFGLEGNAWDWLQLRAGYQIDLENTIDNMVTAGVGISPFDVVNIDVAGSYAGENEFGASANLALTF
ncbi:conjugal transfer protein TraF [Vibrio sp. DW001]|uniref:conjugal transfer protein TraF n=1 Tax=Vibrio sp. DW001 TaxID=2912315 RepID=UPI0023B09A31|nr:conjugal transfer protein TraF [Vibrio sp. DW001]WED29124.1 conjugal transfer protein TraF [Vibrio sp. DW001]